MRNYKSAKDYVKGDKVLLCGSRYIIEDIYRGEIEIPLFDGTKKRVFIPDDEAIVTLKNKKGQKREIAYTTFSQIIDEEIHRKVTREESKKQALKKKNSILEKSTGTEYIVGKGNPKKIKEKDFFVFKNELYIVDNVQTYDEEIMYSIVIIRNPRKSYNENKEYHLYRVSQSQLINIWGNL